MKLYVCEAVKETDIQIWVTTTKLKIVLKSNRRAWGHSGLVRESWYAKN